MITSVASLLLNRRVQPSVRNAVILSRSRSRILRKLERLKNSEEPADVEEEEELEEEQK